MCGVTSKLTAAHTAPQDTNDTSMTDNWFHRLTGFNESGYATTQEKLEVIGRTLHSKVNGKSFGIGEFEMVSLADLRARVGASKAEKGHTRASIVTGDVRQMHRLPEYRGALFQVASQFNALEMVGPSVTPEDGVTRYEHDRTQGPACAIAAGAATIYRNYFASVGGQIGQTARRQLDGLADVGEELSRALNRPVSNLWTMHNGYAMATRAGLDLISTHLLQLDEPARRELSGHLRIGVHTNVEVTDGPSSPGQQVSQVFCSALPVAYGHIEQSHWRGFAQLVLDAAYEATLLAGVLNIQRWGSNIVLLTLLGGGAFGNASDWIHSAIEQAVHQARHHNLDVRLVSYGQPSAQLQTLAKSLSLEK